jgi:N-acyl-D-amino-acid deacylase
MQNRMQYRPDTRPGIVRGVGEGMNVVELDLVIRNGLVIDGTGSPAVRADVGIADGRIAAVGEIDDRPAREFDADGLVVAPGFVDGHTHMDAQVFWDELGSSSCWQGVTTVVLGNCGYTLAPVRPGDTALLSRNIERAEDIPSEALANAVPWSWSTFAEYLDVLDGLPKGVNLAQSIGHSALRIWAMGEAAYQGPATDAQLAEMKQELRRALQAGAIGLTTSSSKTHYTSDDRPVASRFAAWDEIVALVELMGRESAGVFQIGGTEEGLDGRLRDLTVSSGVPILFSVGAFPHLLELVEAAIAAGGQMCGLTHCRPPISTLQSFHTQLSFDFLGPGTWSDVRSRPLNEQRALLQDPQIRERLIREAHHGEYNPVSQGDPFKPDFDSIWIMYSQYLPNPTVAEEAHRRGVDPVQVMIDVALEQDFDIFFLQGFNRPPDEEQILRVLRSPHTAMTFSDSGAHVSQIADASIQTHLLAYWVRERQALPLEEAIRMITRQPAKAWRLYDRGLLAPGYGADVTVFDPDTVAPLAPQVVNDVPGGSPRLEQRATGYKMTLVNGEVFTLDGEATEARPGRLLRAGQMARPGTNDGIR